MWYYGFLFKLSLVTASYTIYQLLSKRNCRNILNQPDIQTLWGEKFVKYTVGDYTSFINLWQLKLSCEGVGENFSNFSVKT